MGILIVSTNISSSAAPAMSYCINPTCPAPDKNSPTTNFCMSCGAKILLKDRYRALKLLGQGGFGKTFKAVDEDQPRKPLCVIKQFAFSNNHPETRQIALKLFYEEAQHLEALGKHDQIPELTAYFDVEGQPYLVQQFIDGQDLEQELATAGTFNQAKIRELLESLLPVLDFLHHQSPPVIHRDIKPANIIRRRSDGGLVLVDFGAAKQATQSMLAKPGTVIGSPEYMSSEQVRGKPVFASDIYSLGVTCIHLLTQISPFDLFDTIQNDWVWRNYLVNNPVDKLLGEVLDGSIVNALARRYESASDVLIALNNKTKSAADPSQSIYYSTSTTKTPQSEPIPLETFSFETAQVKRVSRQVTAVRTDYKRGLFGYKQVEENYIKTIDEWQVQKKTNQANRFIEDLGNGIKLEMVAISGGEFLMGSPDGEGDNSEKPQHKVAVPSFYMGRFPVTQEQYLEIMGENRSECHGNKHPVGGVSWRDAKEFCSKLNLKTGKGYRLPSESEWEYACRAGTTTRYHFGEKYHSDLAAITPYGETKVGSFPANSFGLHDMHGNTYEWCEDSYHQNYFGSPSDGSAWVGDLRVHVVRGVMEKEKYSKGAFGEDRPGVSRSACRMSGTDHPCNVYGFRVACGS
jgi:formylglycine-generating enzyme required for sulfatase activity